MIFLLFGDTLKLLKTPGLTTFVLIALAAVIDSSFLPESSFVVTLILPELWSADKRGLVVLLTSILSMSLVVKRPRSIFFFSISSDAMGKPFKVVYKYRSPSPLTKTSPLPSDFEIPEILVVAVAALEIPNFANSTDPILSLMIVAFFCSSNSTLCVSLLRLVFITTSSRAAALGLRLRSRVTIWLALMAIVSSMV